MRALRCGARVVYEPAAVILHPAKPLAPADERAIARRDGASVGWILARHRYGPRMLGRMVVRPLGGAVLALARRDPERARVAARGAAWARRRLSRRPGGIAQLREELGVTIEPRLEREALDRPPASAGREPVAIA